MIGAIVGSAAIGGAASYLGGQGQADAGKDAAEMQAAMYAQQRRDLKPWMKAGQESVGTLSDLMQSGYFEQPYQMQEDPGYQFRLQQGEQSINRAASARGDFFSGRSGKELSRYGQNLASQEYGAGYGRYQKELANRYDRLSGMSGRGQAAAAGVGAAGMQAATGAGQAGMYGANAKASSYQGMADSAIGGLEGYQTYKGALPKGESPKWW